MGGRGGLAWAAAGAVGGTAEADGRRGGLCGWLRVVGFLWLVLGWKQGQQLGKLSDVHLALAIGGHLAGRLLSGSLGCYRSWQPGCRKPDVSCPPPACLG